MKTLLLVEDGAIETLLMKKALERAGAPCSLQAVTNGNQAVEYLSGSGPYADRQAYPLPVLVLLDLSMPGRNGHEVLKWIRTQPAFEKLPVIVLTSSFEPTDVQSAYGSGANSYLVKPGNLDGLVKILTHLSEGWLNPKTGPE